MQVFYKFFITLQGFPTAKTLDGIFLVTTLPAPITVLFPILTPGRIVVLPPIQTLSPMVTGTPFSRFLFRLSTSKGWVAG